MPIEPASLESLPDRLARLRREREMTEEDLGAPELSPAFVRALEARRVHPSAVALGMLARHLAIPVAALQTLLPPVITNPDWDAWGEDLLVQIESVRPLLYTHPRAFVQVLDLLAATAGAAFAHLPPAPRYRFHYLRANALLRAAEPTAARSDLARALFLARQLPTAGQEVARVRNAIGALYYLQDQPARALTYHRQCLHAIQIGAVKDLTLILVIYTSLANDCWAINDLAEAIATYQEALDRLADVAYPDRQAEIYAGLSLALYAVGDLDHAHDYAQHALTLREETGGSRDIGRLATNLAMIQLARQDYSRVAALLERARQLLTAVGDEGPLSVTFTYYALLELHWGHLDAATRYAAEAVRLSAAVFATQDPMVGILARAYATRTYARALAAAGQVAEQQGDRAGADGLFTQALGLVEQSEYAETAWELGRTFADLLVARGEHERAGVYYRRILVRKDGGARPRR
jgi:tetratricopeptide (TPR) repeat protein